MNQTTANLLKLERAESLLFYEWPLGLRPALEAEIRLLRRRLPSDAIRIYTRLMRAQNHAVVEVRDGACQGCYAPIPDTCLESLANPERITHCPNCGCFLYLPATNLATRTQA